LHNKNICEYNRMDLARKIGYISTEIVRAGNMTVFDLVALGRFPHTNWLGKIDRVSQMAIENSLEKTGLTTFRKRNISELSDGERQKAMIARVLAQDTDIMIMDEPTAFLDISSKFEIINLMLELTREGKTIIFSTHDFNIAVNGGSFDHLFESAIVGFNSADGSFTFRKEPRGNICISGEGMIRKWTERAVLRAGYLVSDMGTGITIRTPNRDNKKWVMVTKETTEHFDSVYDLVRRLQK